MTLDKKISDLFHPHENVYERHARRKKENEQFLGKGLERQATIYIPGVFCYKLIKDVQQHITSKTPASHKLAIYGVAVGCELFFDAVKVASAYGLYRWAKFLLE